MPFYYVNWYSGMHTIILYFPDMHPNMNISLNFNIQVFCAITTSNNVPYSEWQTITDGTKQSAFQCS